ncbi:hypothetical protein Hypma_016306 [Hypsizygus marmoreus]|uniref:Uncharacterized protein n=1 Tax=Hypsizygus marmoreus TaxID=39966 RepID=A0A369J296_HYPMA|nr:hypothetical protein Hypma_016306 [Hypsizygus marmoreus]
MINLCLPATFLGLRLVSAMPFAQIASDVQYVNVSAIALDERNGQYVAYQSDGILVARFPVQAGVFDLEARDTDPTSCNQLTSDDVQKLPGWAKLYKEVTEKYGDGKKKIVTNPDEYPDKTAKVCSDSEPVEIATEGPPSCIENIGSTEGTMDGTEATIKLSFSQGFSASAIWAITKMSAISVQSKFKSKFSFNPKLFKLDFETSVTNTEEWSNWRTDSFQTTSSNRLAQELWLTSPAGEKCKGSIKTRTCNVGGKGSIKLIAFGWVWFNYDSKTGLSGSSDKHYKWAFNIDQMLPDTNDRSSFVDFVGSMKADVNAEYVGVCE